MLCQEEMVQAQRDKGPALAGAWGEAKVKAEAVWVARLRQAPTGSAYAPDAGTKPPMSPDSPVFIEVVPSAAPP